MSVEADEFINNLTLSLMSEAGYAHGTNDSVLTKRELSTVSLLEIIPVDTGNFYAVLDSIVNFSEKFGADPDARHVYENLLLVGVNIEGDVAEKAISDTLKKSKNSGFIGNIILIQKDKAKYITPNNHPIKDRSLKKAIELAMSAESAAKADRENILEDAKKTIEDRKKFTKSIRKTGLINPVTFLISINIIIYITGIILEIKNGVNIPVLLGIQDNAKIAAGEFWRLFTPMFLHSGIPHLFGNMLSLFLLGNIVLKYYSDIEFMAVYIVSGLFGNVLSFFFTDYLSLGASGAIMGLGGVVIYRMFFGNDRKSFRQSGNFASIAFMILFNLLFGVIATGQNIDNFGHFGGFAAGFFAAMIIALIRKKAGNN